MGRLLTIKEALMLLLIFGISRADTRAHHDYKEPRSGFATVRVVRRDAFANNEEILSEASHVIGRGKSSSIAMHLPSCRLYRAGTRRKSRSRLVTIEIAAAFGTRRGWLVHVDVIEEQEAETRRSSCFVSVKPTRVLVGTSDDAFYYIELLLDPSSSNGRLLSDELHRLERKDQDKEQR